MKHFILIILIALNLNAFSQDADKTVTLVVSGSGKTQDEAKQSALRSAIEQAFGAFISSKTEILNDSLVKDEIVSVSNGNIQKFDIISEVQIPEGGFATTLNATVSVTKLTSFVESKGVVVEFKGSVLAANVKQQMLNEQNEIKSISTIVSTCKEILDKSADFEIVSGEPKQINNDNNRWSVPLKINIKFNNNIQQFKQYFITSIKGLSMSPDEVEQYNKLGKKTYKLLIGDPIASGKTDNIEYLKTIAAASPKISYKIKCLGYPASKYKSNDLNKTIDMFYELEKKKHANCRGYHEIEYNDEDIRHGYNFRTENALISIIDLFHYTIHSLLNFEVSNGVDIFNPKRFSDIDRGDDKRLYLYLKIEKDNLNVILLENEPFGVFHIFSGYGRGFGVSGARLYEEKLYSNEGFYNIAKFNFSNPYSHKFNDSGFNRKLGLFKTKFNFLMPSIDQNFNAVISLYDFKVIDEALVTLSYNYELSLSDLEKVSEFKINPIKN